MGGKNHLIFAGQPEKQVTGQLLKLWMEEKLRFFYHNNTGCWCVIFCIGFKQGEHIDAAHAFAHMFNRMKVFLLVIGDFSCNGKHLFNITVHGINDFVLTTVFSVVGIDPAGKIIQIQLVKLIVQKLGGFKSIQFRWCFLVNQADAGKTMSTWLGRIEQAAA